jgi:hypothetical protein
MSSGPAAVVVPQQHTERFATADRAVASLMRRFQRMAPMEPAYPWMQMSLSEGDVLSASASDVLARSIILTKRLSVISHGRVVWPYCGSQAGNRSESDLRG